MPIGTEHDVFAPHQLKAFWYGNDYILKVYIFFGKNEKNYKLWAFVIISLYGIVSNHCKNLWFLSLAVLNFNKANTVKGMLRSCAN